MILRDAIDAYVAWQQAHGARFIASARLLHSFCQHVGGGIGCDAVEGPDVLRFLAGNGPLTRYRANKYGALAGFYRYAISRGHAVRSPLPAPDDEPRQPRSAPPYVFSRDELQRLFGAIDISRQRPVQLDAHTLRALLLLLYGAGLRFGEAQRLTLDDVDLRDAVLTIRDTKFHKNVDRIVIPFNITIRSTFLKKCCVQHFGRTRLVPLHSSTCAVLAEYIARRQRHWAGRSVSPYLFVSSWGNRLDGAQIHRAFYALSRQTGLRGEHDRHGPRLHDFRHRFATSTLVRWYRSEKEPERLLPVLSAYLGHVHIADTQWYLESSPELMREAMRRLENRWEDRS